MIQQTELDDDFLEYSGNQLPRNLKDISFKFSERSEDCGYGYVTRDELLVDNITGTVYDPRERKGVFKNDIYQCRPTRLYTVVPDEAVEAYAQPLIDSGDLKLIYKESLKSGLVTTWKYETVKNFQVTKSKDKDDVFGVQVVLRNSINGNVALSAAVRTLRKICANGLTAWGTDFGARLVHLGDLTEKLRSFRGGIFKTINKLDNAKALLERTTEIQTTQATIQYIIDKTNTPEIYLPDYVQLEPKKRKIAILGKEGQNKTLYEIANDFTWKLSRAEKTHPEHHKVKGELSFLAVTQREQQLNKAVHKIVVSNGRVPQ